jgi:hypothetical protein
MAPVSTLGQLGQPGSSVNTVALVETRISGKEKGGGGTLRLGTMASPAF